VNLAAGWSASIEVRCASPEAAQRLYRVLAPESAREVPRTQVRLHPPKDDQVRLDLDAHDTGALRAAVQTYLGWVQLTEATTRAGLPDPMT
jgi:tRNA threonylcarbamoyladenosine modification (KEOPS) complex  Pcc1 subunit